MIGLAIFMVVFAINSAVHSYLILAYSDDDEVATNVGFYYMANAGGRLLGTLLSGVIFEFYGFAGCLLASGRVGARGRCLVLQPSARVHGNSVDRQTERS